MTDRVSLFEEMTARADALRRDNPELREGLADELQMTFREVQKRRAPQLSTAEWVELFRVWGLEYAARWERQRDEAIAGMIATIDAYARANPPGVLRCVCGEETADPLDPAWMAMHKPHVQAASLERTQEGLERWRAYARSTVDRPQE